MERRGTRDRRRFPGPTCVSTPHGVAFWVVAAAFLLNMAFSAVPTPLYVLYEARDHFSGIMVTIVYAVYAIGVIASLFLPGTSPTGWVVDGYW